MKTFVEKIFNAPAGSIVFAEPDIILSHDNSARIKKLFKNINGADVLHPEKLIVVLDRKMTGTTNELIQDYNSIHRFMEEQKVEHFFDCDKGICHQVLTKYLKQGLIVAGSDSHTCTAGAFNCFAAGLNKTETAVLWKTGKMWFRVPETIKINLKNSLPDGVYAKDLALWIMGMLQSENVAYMSLEYHGEGVRNLTISDRMTLANVSAEMGIKNSVFPPDDALADYFGDYAVQGIWADANAVYYKEFEVDLAKIIPLAMEVTTINEIKAVCEWGEIEIQQGLIGACGTGRIEDLRVVADILKDEHIIQGFQLSIVPASREIYIKAIEEGLIDVISKAGASILGASCGPCLGSSHMILADTKRFISTTNSNSMSRLNSIGVERYIASPATIACTALTGKLSSAKEYQDIQSPFWAIPPVAEMVNEYDTRSKNGVWDYSDLDNISSEQIFAEQFTYKIPMENGMNMKPHLLSGVDLKFADQVNEGDVILAGENFGSGKLIKHAAIGLVAAGVQAVIVKSADRNFYRMAINHGLFVFIAPSFIEKYKIGDSIRIDLEDQRIYLNNEEYKLPEFAPKFIKIIRTGGIVNAFKD